MDWVKQWDATGQNSSSSSSSLPKGSAKSKGKGSNVSRRSFESDRKRFRPQPQNRLQAVERLSRSTAALAQRTARTVAFLISQAVVTILCPELPALKNAAAAIAQDSSDPHETIFQKWGCVVKGLSLDSKTAPHHAETLKAHVMQFSKPSLLEGKVHLCRVKPTFRDRPLYLVQFRVDDSLQNVAIAVIETLVKAGGNVSYYPASRSGEERAVTDALDALDAL
eukprot:TRINITY_DN23068_c0_g1_i1.p1 TRINITY_DN23068_c0_g1~~TRINITY_DN23068_c0_g1_i1.p1  ORF type:complete len:223 (-),score=26.03 TRINITY_DN23068_c0_g1_i1:115-783(-)